MTGLRRSACSAEQGSRWLARCAATVSRSSTDVIGAAPGQPVGAGLFQLMRSALGAFGPFMNGGAAEHVTVWRRRPRTRRPSPKWANGWSNGCPFSRHW